MPPSPYRRRCRNCTLRLDRKYGSRMRLSSFKTNQKSEGEERREREIKTQRLMMIAVWIAFQYSLKHTHTYSCQSTSNHLLILHLRSSISSSSFSVASVLSLTPHSHPSLRFAVKEFCLKNSISPDQLKERLKIFDATLAAVQVSQSVCVYVSWSVSLSVSQSN